MKIIYLILSIFISLLSSFAVKAVDPILSPLYYAPITTPGNPIHMESNDMKVIVDRLNEMKKKNPAFDINPISVERFENPTCKNCPEFLKLNNSVNKILEKAVENPKFVDDELPSKVSKLKMIFYTVAKRMDDNSIQCNIYGNELGFDRDAKMEGQAKFIAEDVFDNGYIEGLILNQSKYERIVYYVRDENQKNVLIQVISEKGKKPMIRYYSYTPTDLEANPYNLPSLGSDDERLKKKKVETNPYSLLSDTITSTPVSPREDTTFSYDPKWEIDHHLPKDYHIADAKTTKEIADGMFLSGETHISLAKGNDATMKFKSKERDIITVSLITKINGSTDHKVIVPYEIRTGEETTALGLKGIIQDETHATSLTLSLGEKAYEYIRATVRENKDNGVKSIIFARDVSIGSMGTTSIIGGRDETSTNFVAFHHGFTTKNKNTTMAVDLKIDNQHRTTLYYTLSSKF